MDLYFDGDLRRVYEVPAQSTFTTDGQGYRAYVPIYAGDVATEITTTELWSAWVDWHSLNLWSTLALDKSGGDARFEDDGGTVYATFDLRLMNGWQIVPADYPHRMVVQGNLFPDANLGEEFDTSRTTSHGVSPRIYFADSLQVLRTTVEGAGASSTPCLDAVYLSVSDEHVPALTVERPELEITIAEPAVDLGAGSECPKIQLPAPIRIEVTCHD